MTFLSHLGLSLDFFGQIAEHLLLAIADLALQTVLSILEVLHQLMLHIVELDLQLFVVFHGFLQILDAAFSLADLILELLHGFLKSRLAFDHALNSIIRIVHLTLGILN